jgi:hypothetical protein
MHRSIAEELDEELLAGDVYRKQNHGDGAGIRTLDSAGMSRVLLPLSYTVSQA